MRVHLVGVSGTGMGSLATLFREAGHEVSGTDVAFDPPVGPTLDRLGIRCQRGYDAAHVTPELDLVVIGNAIRSNNPEAAEVERRGLTRASMSAALRKHFLQKRRALVVTGTHGKTTTSAMCAWILSRAGLEPGWFIGGVPKGLGGAGASIGSTRVRPDRPRSPFVVEGDEYDAVYWHKRPKFLDYVGASDNDVVIVTSVEHDHIDIYPDVTSYERAFRDLARAVPKGGLVVCDARDPRARAIVAHDAECKITWYALHGDDTGDVTPTWLAAPANLAPDGAQTFDVYVGGSACGRFSVPVPGCHNVRNALAAIVACTESFGVPLLDARAHLASFEGVRKRQELLGHPRGVFVYDDFAHHPTAVDETLRALRARHPGGSLWAVFEPRSATACRSLHQEAYARAFKAADRVLLAPLGRSNVPEEEKLDLPRLAREIGPKATANLDLQAIVAEIVRGAREGDTVAILSNGTFGGLHQMVLSGLSQLA